MTAGATGITFRLFGALRDAVGCKEVDLDWREGTVQEALLGFARERGEPARPYLFDSKGNPWRSLIVLVNDEPVGDIRTTRVQAGDTVSVLLPLAGGRPSPAPAPKGEGVGG